MRRLEKTLCETLRTVQKVQAKQISGSHSQLDAGLGRWSVVECVVMSGFDEIKKAREEAGKFSGALRKDLEEEQSWASKHPGWMTLIALGIFLALIVAIVKGCH